MDLSRGIINGYNIMLKGTKADDANKTIIIDSSSSTTPLKVGENFNVNWDGTLSCNKINSLNNDGRQQYAVSIGNNFYVTQGGSAGGSGCNFGGSFSGGFSGTGIGTFKGKGQFDTLTVTGQTQLATNGSTTTCGGNLGVKGQTTILGGLVVTKGFQLGSGDFYIHGNKYSPQDITSTDGTVYAVIGYEKS